MKKPSLSRLWLFVVQQAEAAALSLGFSLSKVLLRFAAQTYFCCLPPPHLCPPPHHTHHPSNHHPPPPHEPPSPLSSLSLSLPLPSRRCRCFGCVSARKPCKLPSADKMPLGRLQQTLVRLRWRQWMYWPTVGERDVRMNGGQHSTDRERVVQRLAPMVASVQTAGSQSSNLRVIVK